MLFSSGALGHLTGSYDAGGSYGLETCEVVGSEGRFVIYQRLRAPDLLPPPFHRDRGVRLPGWHEELSETFASRIGAWLSDLEAKVPPDGGRRQGGRRPGRSTGDRGVHRSFENGTVVEVEEVAA